MKYLAYFLVFFNTVDCKFKNMSLYYTNKDASGDCHNELCKKLEKYNLYEKFLFSLNGFV